MRQQIMAVLFRIFESVDILHHYFCFCFAKPGFADDKAVKPQIGICSLVLEKQRFMKSNLPLALSIIL